MNIQDLRDGMRRVDVEGEVIFVNDERKVNAGGRQARVEEVELRDDSGTVNLSLWDDEIDRVVKGMKIRVSNGYTSAFRGQLKLNIGKYGRMEILEEPEAPAKAEQDTLTSTTINASFSPVQEARIRQIVQEEIYGKQG